MPILSRNPADHAPCPALPALRPVRDADGLAVAALIEACFAEYPGCLFSWDEFPELRAPASWADGRGTRMWVAEDEAGAVVGCLCATPAGSDVELHKFYVARHWRGTGLATSLVEQLFALASESRAERIVLWTDTRFVRAHRFYEKLGFVRGPETRLLHDISDSEEFFYALSLQAPR
jgi:putative acetyltransferase